MENCLLTIHTPQFNTVLSSGKYYYEYTALSAMLVNLTDRGQD